MSSATKLALAVMCSLAWLIGQNQLSASIYTFDTTADLATHFEVDVIAGDRSTHWREGYNASSGFPGSDGGFVHFNVYFASNSIAFKNAPVLLNSFEISSQFSADGFGVTEAIAAELDYRLILYDQNLVPLFDTVLTVNPSGAWETVTFDQPNVYAIWIERTDAAGTFTGSGTGGWWPNIDNVRVNEANDVVPEPLSLLVWAGLASVAGFVKYRRGA